MKKTSLRTIFLFLAGLPLLLQACAGTQLTRRDLDSIETIKVVRYKTPELEVRTVSGAALTCLGGCLTAPVGAAIDVNASKKAHQGVVFPDYGKLLAQNFMRLAPEEIQGWPRMAAANDPVARGYEYKDSALILFDINHVWLTAVGGLTIEGDIIMRDPKGSKILQQHFWYRSIDFGPKISQEEYLADNRKLLIREIPLAAEHTAKELIIKHLKEGL